MAVLEEVTEATARQQKKADRAVPDKDRLSFLLQQRLWGLFFKQPRLSRLEQAVRAEFRSILLPLVPTLGIWDLAAAVAVFLLMVLGLRQEPVSVIPMRARRQVERAGAQAAVAALSAEVPVEREPAESFT